MRRLMLATLMLALLAMPLFGGLTEVADRRAAPQRAAYDVHEWGVFNLRGPDYLTLPADQVPEFMFRCLNPERREPEPNIEELVADKPIVYFHADEEIDISVTVEIPAGSLQYYWPAGDGAVNLLSWPGVTILADDPEAERDFVKAGLPEGHWLHTARDTDSNDIRVSGTDERFLFYEARLEMHNPLQIVDTETGPVLRNVSSRSLTDVTFINRQDGEVLLIDCGDLEPGESWPITGEAKTVNERFVEDQADYLRGLWADCGLTASELDALIDVWKHDFFGRDGRRAIAMMSTAAYDELFPIRLNPQPRSIVRFGVLQIEMP